MKYSTFNFPALPTAPSTPALFIHASLLYVAISLDLFMLLRTRSALLSYKFRSIKRMSQIHFLLS